MKNYLVILSLFIFAPQIQAAEMPGTFTSTVVEVKVTLKDEIAFENTKLQSYESCIKLSKVTKQPLVVCVGCYVDDIQLFLQLKGKVILCYIPGKTAPFPTLESGVVVGIWKDDGSVCVRHDVAAYTFSDPKFRDSLLFNVKVEPSNVTVTYPQVITGYTCVNGVCTPNYGPATPSYVPTTRFGGFQTRTR